MNIILGEEKVQHLREKYTVLELDSFVIGDSPVIKSYTVLENIPIQEMFQVENLFDLHHGVISEYKKKNWDYCLDALPHLIGRWSGEIDSFYQDLVERINQYREKDPGPGWNGVIYRASTLSDTTD
jgi:hypothetical protein